MVLNKKIYYSLEGKGGSGGLGNNTQNSVQKVLNDSFRELEEGLKRKQGNPRQQLQKLRMAGFNEIDNIPTANAAGFTRYRKDIGNGKTKLAVSLLGKNSELIEWGDRFLIDDIETFNILDTQNSIECVCLIVMTDNKYYLYKYSPKSQEVKIVPSFQNNDGSFFTKETIDMEAEELIVKRYIDSEEDFEKQKQLLANCEYTPHQRSRIQALTHYEKKLPSGKIYQILVDEQHKKVIKIGANYVFHGINIIVSPNGGVTYIYVRKDGKISLYKIGQQYGKTQTPIAIQNPDSEDGSFSDIEDIKTFLNNNQDQPKRLN